MELSKAQIWDKCLSIIKDNVSDDAFVKWFKPIVSIKYQDDCLWIQVPTHFYIEQIEEQYSDLIGKTLNRVCGKPTKLMYQVQISDTQVNISTENRQKNQLAPKAELDPQLLRNLTFSNFVEGESNRLARTAGVSIANNPGKNIFNPLFVYGKSGVGKTHLLHAIGNASVEQNPRARVLYVSSHVFQVQYSQAYLQNKINDFIHFYQSVDVLLIDDVHELSGKTGTQNVFFHIFNHLHQMGKQIVFTCDRAPKDLVGMEDRLLTRFKWGLTAEMRQPDYQLRIDILRQKMQQNGLELPDEVVEYIARHAKDNVRDLEGILTSLFAHSIIEGRNTDLKLCREVVENSIQVFDEEKLSVESIEEEVCRYYHLDKTTLHSRSKKQEVARARQVAMFLSKKHTDKSYAYIGEVMGNRNHATVIHACKLVEQSLDLDKALHNDVQKIESALALL
ncbi:MAG: chromosomal replication initiator protein DnaA [Bacteroidales bacterium]|nr:chromosomal replication initiator protein DnaA [Bacteroidales bacterium]